MSDKSRHYILSLVNDGDQPWVVDAETVDLEEAIKIYRTRSWHDEGKRYMLVSCDDCEEDARLLLSQVQGHESETEEFDGGMPCSIEEAAMWREGWGLWERMDGFIELARFDADPKEHFEDDGEAHAFVRARAAAGSSFHAEALARHGTRVED